MDSAKTITRLKGSLCHWFLLFTIWLSSFRDVVALQMLPKPSHILSMSELASPPSSEFFEPIEISPAVIPHYPFPGEPLPPMYPSFPTTYNPVLTGRCPVNFSAISSIMDKTASDCIRPLAALVGNVICCPQFSSLLHIFQGYYSINSDKLVLQSAAADDCFTDIVSILAGRGANSSIPSICSVKSSNITGGSCPVKDVTSFEKTVNTSKLLEACSIVDPLKECCRPICQPAIMEAALQISAAPSIISDNKNIVGQPNHLDALNDCKGVVYSWLSRKLPLDAANTAFRILSACKVNKVCPLEFKQPSEVIIACLFASMLQKGGVMTNIYELCDVDLKDFSLQAYGQQGCLLRSLPADMVYDNSTGFSFTCDLSDNIAAPWPSSSSISSLSLCAPEMSLPALPTSETLGNPGYRCGGLEFLVPIFSLFVFILYAYVLMANPSGTNHESTQPSHGSSSSNGPIHGSLVPAPENSGAAPSLKHNPGISSDWNIEEQLILEEGLTTYASESSIIRYAKIAMKLQNKTVRDVALRCRWMTKKEISKRRKEDHNLTRKSREKKEKVTEPSAKPSHMAAQPGFPPYAQQMITMESDDGIPYKAIGGATGQLLEQNAQYFDQISANFTAHQIHGNISLLGQARDNILKILNKLLSHVADLTVTNL
ncbi:hypothetical protein F0562_034633 [Nyssa sinensis]|uniref:SPARK domain-containing protein n=1 Tax=Nyssa sinensis TaxID=561372 RepID=A0A5J5A9S6_9ASTE|nr:hypothetical protein F0562_034633 [Nyssa sinensis]